MRGVSQAGSGCSKIVCLGRGSTCCPGDRGRVAGLQAEQWVARSVQERDLGTLWGLGQLPPGAGRGAHESRQGLVAGWTGEAEGMKAAELCCS